VGNRFIDPSPRSSPRPESPQHTVSASAVSQVKILRTELRGNVKKCTSKNARVQVFKCQWGLINTMMETYVRSGESREDVECGEARLQYRRRHALNVDALCAENQVLILLLAACGRTSYSN